MTSIGLSLICLIAFSFSIRSISCQEKLDDQFANYLIGYIYRNYPDYIPKLLSYGNEVKDKFFNNNVYNGHILEIKRRSGYKILVANAYKESFDNGLYGSSIKSHTTLYNCRKAIRYCTGNARYCEYHEGSEGAIIILVSSHDGHLLPVSIPDRKSGCLSNGSCDYSHNCTNQLKDIKPNLTHCTPKTFLDLNTRNITILLAQKLEMLTGERPHVVINNVHRRKIDVNRDITLGSFNVPEAERIWQDFQGFIKEAKRNLNGRKGIIFDIHGNKQKEGWNMLGYGLFSEDLDTDEIQANKSSIYSLANHVKIPFESLLRGKASLGHFLQEEGYDTIPSPKNRYTNGGAYFSGDYIIRKHGSIPYWNPSNVDAIQVEISEKCRRKENYPEFVDALARSIFKFINLNYVNKGKEKDLN